MEEKSDKARVVYVCEGCDGRSPVKDDIKHDEEKHKDKKEKKIKKTCEKSGATPHVSGK
jgi:hypothetical protein